MPHPKLLMASLEFLIAAKLEYDLLGKVVTGIAVGRHDNEDVYDCARQRI